MSDANLAGEGAFEQLKGKAKEVLGKTLGSEDLTTKGVLQQEEGEAKREAARLHAEAEAERRSAVQGYADDTTDAARLQVEAVRDESQRKAQLERERAAREAAADAVVEAKEDVVEERAARSEAFVEAREEAARREHRRAVGDASELEDEATRARDNARELDELQQRQAGTR